SPSAPRTPPPSPSAWCWALASRPPPVGLPTGRRGEGRGGGWRRGLTPTPTLPHQGGGSRRAPPRPGRGEPVSCPAARSQEPPDARPHQPRPRPPRPRPAGRAAAAGRRGHAHGRPLVRLAAMARLADRPFLPARGPPAVRLH